MINKITLHNIATFTNLTEVSDLKKLNFFFGYNGTGKSTIVKYLRNISLGDSLKSHQYNSCSQVGYNSSNHQILIFDDVFVNDNFHQQDTLKGIFSLNQTNKEIDEEIEKEENSIKNYDLFVKKKEKQAVDIIALKDKDYQNLINFCFDIRNEFKTFDKVKLSDARNKVNHFKKIESVLNQKKLSVNIGDLTTQYNHIYEHRYVKVEKIISPLMYRNIRQIENKINGLLSEIIIGNQDVDIAALIKELNSSKWVEDGAKYLEKTDSICPFCQKETIDNEFKQQLTSYFNSSYKDKIEALKKLKQQYEEAINELFFLLDEITLIYNPNNTTSSLKNNLTILLNKSLKIIEDKIATPNLKISISSINKFKKEISFLNSSIKINNNDFEQLDAKQKEFIESIWAYMASKSKDKIEKYQETEAQYNKILNLCSGLIDREKNKINNSKTKIDELRIQTVSTKEAVDNINSMLRNTGIEGFEIKEKEKKNNISLYYLERNNSEQEDHVFKTLSEGERNFIAFLYFYQMCLGIDNTENSTKKKIIVIDDPVSSLDSNVLFIVSTLIHDLIEQEDNKSKKDNFLRKNIEQVFIFTHNVYFYKEVVFDKRPICTSQKHYHVTKTNNVSDVEDKNDQKIVDDDYSLLWKTLKELKNKNPNKSQNIVISNLMRRVLESYVKFIGIRNQNSVWDSLYNEDKHTPQYFIKSAFISTINDESHEVRLHDSLYYQKITNENPALLFDIFENIFEKIGKEHYEFMMDMKFEEN